MAKISRIELVAHVDYGDRLDGKWQYTAEKRAETILVGSSEVDMRQVFGRVVFAREGGKQTLRFRATKARRVEIFVPKSLSWVSFSDVKIMSRELSPQAPHSSKIGSERSKD